MKLAFYKSLWCFVAAPWNDYCYALESQRHVGKNIKLFFYSVCYYKKNGVGNEITERRKYIIMF